MNKIKTLLLSALVLGLALVVPAVAQTSTPAPAVSAPEGGPVI